MPVDRRIYTQSVQRTRSLSASWLGCLTRKHDRHTNSPGRLGGIRDPGSARSSVSSSSLLVVLLLVEETAGGALQQQHVEGLFDVVGMELLFEVEGLVVLVLLALRLGGLDGGVAHDDDSVGVVEIVDVVDVVDVIGVGVIVLVEQVILVERGRAELVLAHLGVRSASRSGSCSSSSNSSSGMKLRPPVQRVRQYTPCAGARAAPFRTGTQSPGEEKREPRRPLGPLFGPTRSGADELFQRLLPGLLDSTRPRHLRATSRFSEAHDLGEWRPGVAQ